MSCLETAKSQVKRGICRTIDLGRPRRGEPVMATTAPLMVRIPIEDMQVLRLLADARDIHPTDFASWLVTTWLAGPGRQELLTRLAGTKVALEQPAPRPRRPRQIRGQITVDDAIAETG